MSSLVQDHVKTQPKSGREATETFLQGSGDALLSYENEALFIEREGDPVQHVTPPQTFKIENPVAVLSKSPNAARAKAFNDFLYTPEAQRLWAQAGFRPVDATVAQEFAADFPQPQKLWTIDDLGGWKTVNDSLFKKDVGSIAVIYDKAGRCRDDDPDPGRQDAHPHSPLASLPPDSRLRDRVPPAPGVRRRRGGLALAQHHGPAAPRGAHGHPSKRASADSGRP